MAEEQDVRKSGPIPVNVQETEPWVGGGTFIWPENRFQWQVLDAIFDEQNGAMVVRYNTRCIAVPEGEDESLVGRALGNTFACEGDRANFHHGWIEAVAPEALEHLDDDGYPQLEYMTGGDDGEGAIFDGDTFTDSWTNNEGQERQRTKINVASIEQIEPAKVAAKEQKRGRGRPPKKRA